MIPVKQILRLIKINRVLVKYELDEIILAAHLFRPVRFLLHVVPWRWFGRNHDPRGKRIRMALEELGPIFVKFGQILSTRRDLLPDDIAEELALLQDQVTPFPGDEARLIIEKSYGHSIEKVLNYFDETPLASASIAQVHSAETFDGKSVIVKVLRPNIEKVIQRDVALLGTIAGLAEKYWADGKRLRPREVVAEFEKTIFDELDLMREAANASQLRRNFINSELLYVPEINWPLTRRNVLVMERISGTPISQIDKLREKNIDLKKLSENGVEIFFTQVFSHNFFHADMHPGNIFVADNGCYIAVDFGIMGTLTTEDQRYLAENFLAFFNRDYRRVAELHVESKWIPEGTRIDEFESAIRAVCEPIFERPLKEISFGHLLLRLFQTARRFDMEIQPQLVLLQKTLLNIEGLGRQLYPDLDLWQTAKPFLERWMSENIGIRGLIRSLKTNVPQWAEKLPEIPILLHKTLEQLQNGTLEINWKSRELENIKKEIKRANQRMIVAITGTGLIISAAILLALDGFSPRMLGDAPLLSWVLGGVGAAILISVWPRER